MPRTDRFESLDVLRGVAVLGIFMVNMEAFAAPPTAYVNPSVLSGYAAELGAWAFVNTFFTFKFVTLFSAMFGAGLVLMLGADAASDRMGVHRARMFWLLVIGLAHAYLLWFGDILVPYAVAGFLAVGARTWSVPRLLFMGLVLLALNALVFAAKLGMALMPAEEYAAMLAEVWSLSPEALAAEQAIYEGSWPGRVPAMASFTLEAQVGQLLAFMPRIIGVMMFGMAAYKSGFLTARWSMATYLAVGVVATALGVAGSHWASMAKIAVDFDMVRGVPAMQALYWASLVQAFGYAALVMAVCKLDLLKLARAPFAAAGRMAFSNYLGCTLVAVLIFYGPPGLGLIGELTRDEQIRLVLIFWAVMLVVSPVWLAVFRFGPMEWVWRSATYGKLQPLLRAKTGASG